MSRLYLLNIIQILCLFSLAACDDVNTQAPIGDCGSGTAQIGVGDGYLEILCGCNEAQGTLIVSPSVLTCTVPSGGAFVFFQYVGTHLQHQIISTGTPSFLSSPISDPLALNPVRVHEVQLTTSGTYTFQDQMNSGMTGQIVVP